MKTLRTLLILAFMMSIGQLQATEQCTTIKQGSFLVVKHKKLKKLKKHKRQSKQTNYWTSKKFKLKTKNKKR